MDNPAGKQKLSFNMSATAAYCGSPSRVSRRFEPVRSKYIASSWLVPALDPIKAERELALEIDADDK